MGQTTTQVFGESNPQAKKFLKQIQNPVLQRLFLIGKLPSAFFMGVRIRSVSPEEAQVTVPYGWRSQNPFKSTYFAAQAAAAEMSTGVLSMLALQGKGKVSMLITKSEGNYSKKANKLATFTCIDGQKIAQAVQQAIKTGEGREVRTLSIGTIIGDNGEPVEVSRFYFTWSFRGKSK
jgi:hypothetical protein